MRRVATSCLALSLLCSCGVTRESFPDQYARAWCDRLRQCARGDFDRWYDGSTSTCRQEVSADMDHGLEAMESFLPDCELDLDEAHDCLDAVRRATCAEFSAGDLDGHCGAYLVDC